LIAAADNRFEMNDKSKALLLYEKASQMYPQKDEHVQQRILELEDYR
jgi:hypothetical protein